MSIKISASRAAEWMNSQGYPYSDFGDLEPSKHTY